MWFLQNPVNCGENLDSKKTFIWSRTVLSSILDTWERTLTGQLFSLLNSSYFFNTGVTSANLSWFGKQPFSNEELSLFVSIAILIKCSLKTFDSLLSSETMQSFSEIIILSEKLPLSDK